MAVSTSDKLRRTVLAQKRKIMKLEQAIEILVIEKANLSERAAELRGLNEGLLEALKKPQPVAVEQGPIVPNLEQWGAQLDSEKEEDPAESIQTGLMRRIGEIWGDSLSLEELIARGEAYKEAHEETPDG